MSQASVNKGQCLSQIVNDARLTRDNITLVGKSPAGLVGLFLAVGVVGIVLTLIGSQVVGIDHALAAYHVGVMGVLGICLGSLFWVMLSHVFAMTWNVALRRQFENVMRAMWLVLILMLPIMLIEVISHGVMFTWMDTHYVSSDPIYVHKSGYLNVPFFILRFAVYFGLWLLLIRKFWTWQREQDETGDRWLSNKARFTSSWGLLVFGITCAFAAFDWLMSLDYHFFSTMWGVYFFAGAAYSAMAVNILITRGLNAMGKMNGVVTVEHRHDQGKLLFAFTVFWAYIGFSQYFLIWYANIPEETSYMLARKVNYPNLTMALVLGHFCLPFLILLPRPVKRSGMLITIMAIWAVVIHFIDMYWIIRPMADAHLTYKGEEPLGMSVIWLDIAGVVGVVGIFAAVVVRNIFSGPLIPVNDPRLPGCLHHKNYV
ncbi:MAG: hypothetical protein ED559_03600 [Phycisphaera sp.]|nr:MAG: hypothetical protein ED559_03600 [Phycisphaera sp.]